MRSLTMTGIVDATVDHPATGPTIDGVNVAAAIVAKFSYGDELTVMLGAHSEQGSLAISEGEPGWSELTDWLLDTIQIGDLDLITALDQHDRQIVTLQIDDGPAPADVAPEVSHRPRRRLGSANELFSF